MGDITKKFDDFKNKEVKKFDKDKEYQPLSNLANVVTSSDSG